MTVYKKENTGRVAFMEATSLFFADADLKNIKGDDLEKAY